MISARQLLTWMDGRNGSSFQGVAFDSPSGQMTFRLAPAAGARGLQAMVPAASRTGALLALSRDGQLVSTETRIVKGITYAVFDAAAGSYVATYPPGPPKPSAASPTVTTGGSAADGSAKANPPRRADDVARRRGPLPRSPASVR